MPVSVFGARPEPRFLERLAGVGVDRAIVYVAPQEPEAVERQLDEYARLL